MRKTILLTICLMLGVGFTAFAQTTKEERVQKILQQNQQREIYNAELEEAMLGFRQGAEYSYRSFSTVGVMSGNKHGFHYLAGYRFTKHWYVGGIVGVDLTTPFTITREGYMDDKLNYSIEREDKVYVPVIADVRFYFKPKRVSTYLFTNLGAEFSSSTSSIFVFGLGWDVHTIKDQCVNIGLGIGMGGWESADGTHNTPISGYDSGYEQTDGFVFNFKIGYSF